MVLGVKLRRNKEGKLMFRRNEIPEVTNDLAKRELFSVCRTLVGHYPQEIIVEVIREDSVKEEWNIRTDPERVIWSDASSLILGTLLGIGGVPGEYAVGLRKKDDSTHINVAKLAATIRASTWI